MGKATRGMRKSRRSVVSVTAALALAVFALAPPAGADEYNPQEAGHPVRILAYIVHPVGVAFDYLLLRPAHWIGHHEPFQTIFGHEHEDD